MPDTGASASNAGWKSECWEENGPQPGRGSFHEAGTAEAALRDLRTGKRINSLRAWARQRVLCSSVYKRAKAWHAHLMARHFIRRRITSPDEELLRKCCAKSIWHATFLGGANQPRHLLGRRDSACESGTPHFDKNQDGGQPSARPPSCFGWRALTGQFPASRCRSTRRWQGCH
jgi:hypothetical protein